jgi:hypothetical protein
MQRRKWIMLVSSLAVLTAVVGFCMAQAGNQPGPAGQPFMPPQGGSVGPGAGQGGPGGPGGPGMRPGGPGSAPARPGQVGEFIGMVHQLAAMTFNSEVMGVMGVGALKDERKPAEAIKDLEEQLKDVKTQGIRNAIHLTLKDLYRQLGESDKAIEHIKALIAENDKAIQAKGK